ncbi:MAG: hypothetical protein AAGF95_14970 [Chloroflexota bacterium]
MEVEFLIGKHEITGGPVVKAVVPEKVSFEQMVEVQQYVFTDIFEQIGLDAHPACLSGLEMFAFEERFEQVIRAQF